MNYSDLFYYYGFINIATIIYYILKNFFSKKASFIGDNDKSIEEVSKEILKRGVKINIGSIVSLLGILWSILGCFSIYKIYFIIMFLSFIFSGVMMVLNNNKPSEQSKIYYLSCSLNILLTLIILHNYFIK
jgi:hypothetical protein